MFNNFNNNRIVINTADFTISDVFYANSDDADGRILEVQLTDNGLITDSTGYSLELGFATSQNTTGLVSFTVMDYTQGLYKIAYPTSMMIPGDVTCELRIFYLTNLTVTKSFIVTISESVINESTIEATNDFSALTTALGTVNQYDTRITTLEQASENIAYFNNDAGDGVTIPYFTDADKLGGYDSSYYAKQADLDAIVADVTVDSEVILARNSNLYGAYGSLDARLEAIEGKEKTDIQGVNIAIANSETAIKDLAETTKSVIPDVKVFTYSRSSVLSSNAREGQMNVKVSGNTMKNEVVNGNFANGYVGFNSDVATVSVANNIATLTPTVLSAGTGFYRTITTIKQGNKYYMSGLIYPKYANRTLFGDQSTFAVDTSSIIPNVWNRVSGVATKGASNTFVWYHQTNTNYVLGDSFKFKDLILIDMGSDTSNPLYNKTVAEMDAMTPYYFDGFSDVKAGVIRTVGKNLFNKFKATIGYTVSNTTGLLSIDSTYDTTNFIKVNSSTSYIKSNTLNLAYYDINKVFISGTTGSATFTTPIGCAYIRCSVLHSAIDIMQIELGSTATIYENYISTTKYLPYASLKSLPNNIKDYIDGSRYVKNVSDVKTLIASDITEFNNSTYTNIDFVIINPAITNNPTMYQRNLDSPFGTKLSTSVSQPLNNGTVDSTTSAWKHGSSSNGQVYILIPKGTYANLAAAQTALAGTKIIYQLATPIITEILPNTVKSSPNGSVQYLNIRGEVGYYSANIAVTNSFLPIKSLLSVKKISIADGSETNIDLATCTIASGGFSFTSTALTNGDLVDWNYEFDSALSTTPLIDYEYNNEIGVSFAQISDKTIANTTTETSLFGTGIGSLTIPAGYLSQGRTIFIRTIGYMSGTNGDNSTVKVKLGSTTLVTNTSAIPSTLTDVIFELKYTITCRSIGVTGTVIGEGMTTMLGGTGFATSTHRPLLSKTATTIDTTIPQTIDLTYTWGTARVGNTITTTVVTVDMLN